MVESISKLRINQNNINIKRLIYALRRALNIKPEESRKALCFFSLFSCVVYYNTMLLICSQTLFITKVGTKYVPMAYICISLINIAMSIIVGKSFTKSDKSKTFGFYIFGIAFIHLFNFFVVFKLSDISILLAFVFLISQVIMTFLQVTRWMIIQDALDVESSKRLVPMAMLGMEAGFILAGLTMKYLQHFIPFSVLFLLDGLVLVPIFLLARTIQKKYANTIQQKSNNREQIRSIEKNETNRKGVLSYLFGNRFYLYLLIIGVMAATLFYTNDYLFNIAAVHFYPNAKECSVYLASYVVISTLFMLPFELFIFTRMVTRIGTYNMVYFIIAMAFITVSLMFWGKIPLIILISKALIEPYVLTFTSTLNQMFYQPIDSKNRDMVIPFMENVIAAGGMVLGGIVTFLAPLGIIPVEFLSYGSFVVIVVMIFIWMFNRNRFLKVIKGSITLSQKFDFNKLIGRNGIRSMMPYFENKIRTGSFIEQKTLVSFVSQLDFEEKNVLLKDIFKKGDIELQLKIFEVIFKNSKFYKLIGEIISYTNVKIHPILLEYIFTYFDEVKTNSDFHRIKDYINSISVPEADEYYTNIKKFILEEEKEDYVKVLENLLFKRRHEDYQKMLLIMIHNESKEVNIEFFNKITPIVKEYASLPAEFLRLAGIYDTSNEVVAGLIQRQFDYDTIQKVSLNYNNQKLIETCLKQDTFVSKVQLLSAASKMEESNLRGLFNVADEILIFLKGLSEEKNKLKNSTHYVKDMLINELTRIENTALAVVIEYLLAYYNIPRINNITEILNSDELKKNLCEMVHNAFPVKTGKKVLNIIKGEAGSLGMQYDYEKLRLGVGKDLVMKLYQWATSDNVLPDDIALLEKLYSLYEIFAFKEVKFNTLQYIVSMAEEHLAEPGEIVIKENGEPNDIYIMLAGELDIYKKNKNISSIQEKTFLGEGALISGLRSAATVVVKKKAHFLKLKGEEFLRLMDQDPNITIGLTRIVGKRLINVSKQI